MELNEAFASQSVACMDELGLDPARVNPNGGAIALGHPLGASGARLVTMLVHELARTGGRYGLASMCIGVGQGIATIVERVEGMTVGWHRGRSGARPCGAPPRSPAASRATPRLPRGRSGSWWATRGPMAPRTGVVRRSRRAAEAGATSRRWPTRLRQAAGRGARAQWRTAAAERGGAVRAQPTRNRAAHPRPRSRPAAGRTCDGVSAGVLDEIRCGA